MISLSIIDFIYYITLSILGIGLSIKYLELVKISKVFEPKQSFDWAIVGRDALLVHKYSKLFENLYSRKGVIILCSISLLSFTFIHFVIGNVYIYKILIVFMIVSNLLIYYRQGYGSDGADQMAFVILISILLCFVLSNNITIKSIGISFISAQLLLSYIVSGGAKLISKQWRSGIAIVGVLSTYTYGTDFTRRVLKRNNVLAKFLCWSVIIMELLFPLVLLLDGNMFNVALLIGISFHVSIGLIMGLNDFIWSFSAAYPSLYYFHNYIIQ